MCMYICMYIPSGHLFLLADFSSILTSEEFFLDAKSIVNLDNQHESLFFAFP